MTDTVIEFLEDAKEIEEACNDSRKPDPRVNATPFFTVDTTNRKKTRKTQ